MNADEMEFLRLLRRLSPEQRRVFNQLVHLLVPVQHGGNILDEPHDDDGEA